MESGTYKKSPKAVEINAVPQMLLRREVNLATCAMFFITTVSFRLECLDTTNLWVETDAKCTITSCPTLSISYKTITTRLSVVLTQRKDTIFWVLVKVGIKNWKIIKSLMPKTVDRQLRLYDTSNGRFKLLKTIEARDVGWSILDTAFSPDGHYVVYSSWSECSKSRVM